MSQSYHNLQITYKRTTIVQYIHCNVKHELQILVKTLSGKKKILEDEAGFNNSARPSDMVGKNLANSHFLGKEKNSVRSRLVFARQKEILRILI